MQINPSLEKHFNRFVLRGLGACLLAMLGILAVGLIFWQLRQTIPFGLAIGLFCICGSAWLFGARVFMGEVIPDIEQVFEESSEEDLRRVISAHPPSTDIHILAQKALSKRRGIA